MKMAFAGAVEGSRRALSALCAHGLAPDLVVTLPPQAADRHSDFADLAAVARGAGCDVHFTRNINHDDTCQVLEAMEPDIILVIGWSQLCHERFRNIPAIGLIGFHPAPLPAFRGRAAIPWTILARLDQTAATLFWIDEGCDTGDILMQSPFAVTHDETARTLYDKHIEALCKMLPRAVEQVANGQITRIRQDPLRASYCARRRPEDGRIDWTRPAQELDRLVRAVGRTLSGRVHRNGRAQDRHRGSPGP